MGVNASPMELTGVNGSYRFAQGVNGRYNWRTKSMEDEKHFGQLQHSSVNSTAAGCYLPLTPNNSL
jgi:hypothetical protein